MNHINFSIVAYLTGKDFKVVREKQKEVSEVTSSKKCLIDWLPHITLGDGIVVNREDMEYVEMEFNKFAESHEVITAKIKGFGGTDTWKGAIPGKITPYVLWLDIEIDNKLVNLHNDLKNFITSKNETWLPRSLSYTPHITIAFSDLDKSGYEKGLNYLKNKSLERDFEINHVSLVECYGDGNMTSVEHKRYYFKK